MYQLAPNQCKTNSQGFSDLERTFKKPANTRRVALIGDSVAEGLGVDISKATFAKLLENQLNEADFTHRYGVIVFAVSGYTTSHDLAEAFRTHDWREVAIIQNDSTPDPWHPNPNGHKIIADAIFPHLKAYFGIGKSAKSPILPAKF
ncbi:MAG: hypothetical protein H6581_18060 [Bacteroidia bacterium]|nr:hypothetical protein [Bacteroidia bacterium]